MRLSYLLMFVSDFGRPDSVGEYLAIVWIWNLGREVVLCIASDLSWLLVSITLGLSVFGVFVFALGSEELETMELHLEQAIHFRTITFLIGWPADPPTFAPITATIFASS